MFMSKIAYTGKPTLPGYAYQKSFQMDKNWTIYLTFILISNMHLVIFGPELLKFKGPIKLLLSVRQSVSLSVRLSVTHFSRNWL